MGRTCTGCMVHGSPVCLRIAAHQSCCCRSQGDVAVQEVVGDEAATAPSAPKRQRRAAAPAAPPAVAPSPAPPTVPLCPAPAPAAAKQGAEGAKSRPSGRAFAVLYAVPYKFAVSHRP